MSAGHLVPEEVRLAVLLLLEQAHQGQTVTTEIISQHRDGTHFSGARNRCARSD